MIGSSIVILAIVAIVVVLVMKKERFSIVSGTVASSGQGTTLSPISYLTSDKNGNINASTNGIFTNLDIANNFTLQGYSGNVGDVLVSNGGNAPPVWAGLGNFFKLLATTTYNVPSPGALSNGLAILSIPLNFNITPDMVIIVNISMTAFTTLTGVYNLTVNGTLGNSKYTKAGFYCGSNGFTNNFSFIFTNISESSTTFTLSATDQGYYTGNPQITDNVLIYCISNYTSN